MKPKPIEFYEARANIAKALAHPTRLLLLDALKAEPMCVSDLTSLVGADQSTVSKHLALLKSVGLVCTRKEGTMVYYSVRCQCLDSFFNCIQAVLEQRLKGECAVL